MERLHSCSNATFVPAHSFCFALSPFLLSVPSLSPSFFLLFPLPIAGGPWDEWYTAVLWSEAGGRHLPDCETAVVEGSTGSRIRDLGQKTSWAGKLHSDCMSAEAWPCHQNHLHLATSRHRSPISALKSTSHFHKKISTGRWEESRLGGKTCSVKLSQNVAIKVMRRHRNIVYLAFHGFCRGRVLLVFFSRPVKHKPVTLLNTITLNWTWGT